VDLVTIVFLVAGAVLLLSELFAPGLVALFLGVAALGVGGLRAVGLIESVAVSVFAWMGLSTALTVSLRNFVKKRLPAVSWKRLTDENVEAIGQVVEVLEPISEDEGSGRIRFQGTTWPAISIRGVIPKGRRAKLVVRQNLSWLVEPIDELPEGD
jgi:inner membrane protein